jgi:hypothetical protein
VGEITVSVPNDSIECDKCLQFTTNSKLVEEPQGGIIKIDEPIGDWLGTVVMYSGGLGDWYWSNIDIGAKFISD